MEFHEITEADIQELMDEFQECFKQASEECSDKRTRLQRVLDGDEEDHYELSRDWSDGFLNTESMLCWAEDLQKKEEPIQGPDLWGDEFELSDEELRAWREKHG